MNLKEDHYIDINDFQKVSLKVGTIVKVENYPEARKPSYKLWVDFGNDIIKKSAAQITAHYSTSDLIGKQVICVTNLKPRQIGTFISEVLVTGFADEEGKVLLAVPDKKIKNGQILF